MMISRRSLLIAAGSLTVASALHAEGRSRPIAKKGLAGAAPSASGLRTSWYYGWGVHPSAEGAERRGLRFDSVGFHHYGSSDPDDFLKILGHVHDLYRRPIWVTEFAIADWHARGGVRNRFSERDAIRFIETVCPVMERTAWVRGYAWYPWGKPGAGGPLSASAFFQPDGSLTDAGRAYAMV